MVSPWIQGLVDRLSQWLPIELAHAAIAVAVAALGYVLARGARYVVTRLLRRVSHQILSLSHRASERAGLAHPVEATPGAEDAAIDLSGRVVFWLVFTIFLGAATAVLGFPVLSAWLEGLAGYLPQVLAAAAIVLLGVLSGMLLRIVVVAAARSAGFGYARSLGRAAQIAVLALAGAVAIEELGIRVTFLIVVAAVVLSAAFGGAALAFGLGARDSVGNLLASHYLSKWYRVGQRVRLGEHEGRIIEMLPSAVVLRTDAGKLYVPARRFSEAPSLLVGEEEGE